MEEKLTVKEVLVITRDILRNIGSIPIGEAEHIGVPVSRAIENLEECIKAINDGEKRAEDAKGDECGNADAE